MNWIDEACMDLEIYRLKRVGRKYMDFYDLWREWLERE